VCYFANSVGVNLSKPIFWVVAQAKTE